VPTSSCSGISSGSGWRGASRPSCPRCTTKGRWPEWSGLLRVAGVPFSPVNTFEEIYTDEQVLHNKMLLELEDPVHGTIRTVNNPLTL
jgi:crotonobetainyl-CoA:carnitine CoA-transferase CaiB-like acyl-CoA transferase